MGNLGFGAKNLAFVFHCAWSFSVQGVCVYSASFLRFGLNKRTTKRQPKKNKKTKIKNLTLKKLNNLYEMPGEGPGWLL